MNTLLGQKIEMSQVFKDDGTVVPVTLLTGGPCVVTQAKTKENDGYQSIQLGFGNRRRQTRPMEGHLKKSGASPRFLREVRLKDSDSIEAKVGDTLNIGDVLAIGDKVAVTATSKGKGFAGVVKRWGFHGGPKTHGQSDRLRHGGSIGTQRDSRVYKGKKMPGRTGGDRVTVKGLEVIEIDGTKNQLKVKGAVPGKRGSLVVIRKTGTKNDGG